MALGVGAEPDSEPFTTSLYYYVLRRFINWYGPDGG